MKLLLSSFFAAFLCTPLAFAAECDKCKDKEKKEETTLAGKCKDGECDKDKKEDPALAHCGKCKKDKEHEEEEKKEGTLA